MHEVIPTTASVGVSRRQRHAVTPVGDGSHPGQHVDALRDSQGMPRKMLIEWFMN